MLKQIEENSFLVGGAVRDKLLGINAKDKDWVVVGCTPEMMQAAGFIQVGTDFPVFLHPKTQQEYALARKERKIGNGHKGFDCEFDTQVSLEEDLQRRDLTINAMALDKNNQLIDPYSGSQDLHNKQLRHVSSAFSEDPLRILRLARFYARFQHLGFSINAETQALCIQMAQQGMLEHLVAERVWQETKRALAEPHADAYFIALEKMQAMAFWFVELQTLWQANHSHQSLLTLIQSNTFNVKHRLNWAALTQYLQAQPLKQLQQRLKVPNTHSELASLACRWRQQAQQGANLEPQQLLTLFNQFDVWRKPQRFNDFLLLCQADQQAKEKQPINPYLPAQFYLQLLDKLRQIDVQQFIAQGAKGAQIGERLQQARLHCICQFKEIK